LAQARLSNPRRRQKRWRSTPERWFSSGPAAPPAPTAVAAQRATATCACNWPRIGRPAGTQGHRAEPVLLGATNPRTTIDFTLVLRLPGQAHLTRFLNQLTDPVAPHYRHFIGAAEFGERLGVSRSVLDRARAQLARDGVQITASYPQRTALDVRANAGTIDRVFDVRLMDWRNAG